MKRGRGRRWGAWAVLLIAGCGSGSGSSDWGRARGGDAGRDGGDTKDAAGGDARDAARGDASAVSNYLSQWLILECQYQVLCGGAPDMATCLASLQGVYPWAEAQLLKDVSEGTVIFDAAEASACLAALANPACTATWLGANSKQSSQACPGVLTGTLPPQSACFLDEECAGSAGCQPTDSSCNPLTRCCAGTCTPQTQPIPLYGACSTQGLSCVYGAYCGAADGGMVCLPQSDTVGAPCVLDGNQCAFPLHCAYPDPDSSVGTCAPPAADGAPCDNGPDAVIGCESLTHFCNPTTGNCDPVNPAGGSCGVQTAVQCVGWEYCGTGSVCTPWPGPGDACTPAVTPCLLDLACDPTSDTCALPSAPNCGS
jgi:hypothetical protein